MSSAPWLAYAPVVAELLPPAAALARLARDRARLGIVGWCLTLFTADVIAMIQARAYHTNNLWTDYISTALSGAVMLWTLSRWQMKSVPRLALLVLIPLYLVAHLALVLTIENTENFSLVSDTLNGLLLLSLVLYTLIARSLHERERLTDFDWFWVCSGLALYFGAAMAVGPLYRVLLARRVDLLMDVILMKSVTDTVAMMAIARGLLCPIPSPRSSGFSSPPSLRSLSSS